MNTNKLAHLPVPHRLSRRPQPPKHLSASSKKWFRSVVADFVMDETDVRGLIRACEQYDIADWARDTLKAEGRVLTDTKGTKYAHPAVKMEKDSTTLAQRIVRDLKLDIPPPRAPGRPGGSPGPTPQRRN